MRVAGARLLVVEDDPILGSLWVDVLSDAGAVVAGPCTTVRQALSHIREHHPVAALLDIQLLEGESYPVARALAAAGIPFVFLSSNDPADLPAEFSSHPYLRKPVGIRELMGALERFPQPH